MAISPILIPIFGVIGTFGSIIWIAYVVLEVLRTRQRVKLTTELQTKLLDRITSVNELGAFLNTEAGAQFLKGLNVEAAGPHARILRAAQVGTVMTVLGLSLFLWVWMTPMMPVPAVNTMNGIATIVMALGVGFLAASAISYRLSKRMGLLDSRDQHEGGHHAPAV